MKTSAWIRNRPRRPQASVRLFCFPYAGAGGIVYRDWPNILAPDIDVCAVEPPGRWTRAREPLLRSLNEFIRELDRELAGFLDIPFALFGYSLGALQAFEWARHLRRQGGPSPSHLLVAARSAPQVQGKRASIARLPQAEFLRHLQARYGALDPLILSDQEMLARMTRVLKADLEMHESYVYRCEPPLKCPVHAYAGLDDETAPPHEVFSWRGQTVGRFDGRTFSGAHFFLRQHGTELARTVGEALRVGGPASESAEQGVV
jgi:surfactin synthase thioesterase subunit